MVTQGLSIVTVGAILFVACIVAIVSRRLHLPYSVGLVAAGIMLALLPISLEPPLSRDLIFTVFLPPLVFDAAVQLKWQPFAKNLPLTLLLAFVGVAIATAIVGAGMHYLLDWSWIGALLFGVLIAATDPVAVIATFKDLNAERRLRLIVESESLLNDGVAAVGFSIVVGMAAGSSSGPLPVLGTFLWTVIGGVAAGGAIAGALLLIAGRTKDHLVEITLTAVAAYASFLFAEHFGMSGVLASLTAGLVIGNLGWRGAISEAGRGHVLAFWEFAAFLANSIVFIMIGSHEAHQPISAYAGAAAIAILLALIGRAAAVYPLAALVWRTPLHIDARYQHVLFWGGLRGALALALALAIPENVPERQQIIVIAFAAVAFSIFVQGLTMPWLVRRFSLSGRTDGD